ncbi:MAG: N(4)-(beta-N-acetylglucosaminyl)-L-asparaginase [Planctomycetota bacterium]|jgi:N4-(beta-N-acetylglucosaminyl)-L-asparaginase
MSESINRRDLIVAAAGLGAAATLPAMAQNIKRPVRQGQNPNTTDTVVVASSNGIETVRIAREHIESGGDPLDAIVEGVAIVENDPNDSSVGYGGLPDEDGNVTLDSCCMHGPMHRSGAVAAIQNIKNPAQVAREVARRTDHCILVGEGAKRFALKCGFEEENLLTERSRAAWLRWRSRLSKDDDWLDKEQFDLPTDGEPVSRAPRDLDELPEAIAHEKGDIVWRDGIPYTTGTIHCSALTRTGDLAGCTTTSGLSWKIPGRIGDSPIIGAGCYTDNAWGSAGATGRGEAVIQICGAHTIVTLMGQGKHPKDACVEALRMIAERTRVNRLLDDDGRPDFNVIFYAVDKSGRYGSAAFREGRKFAVADKAGARHEDCAFLYRA